jgi:hypothetical protein
LRAENDTVPYAGGSFSARKYYYREIFVRKYVIEVEVKS